MVDAPLRCVIEIPKGSRNKYEYDRELGAIKLDRFISASVVYPTDYGYVPETLAPDGDPLDVCCACPSPPSPGASCSPTRSGCSRFACRLREQVAELAAGADPTSAVALAPFLRDLAEAEKAALNAAVVLHARVRDHPLAARGRHPFERSRAR